MFPSRSRRPTRSDPRRRLVAQPTGVQAGRPQFHGTDAPVVLGLDLAGVVVAVGHGVSGVAVGDAVAAMADLNGDGGWVATGGSGGEGGYAVARQFLTVRKPPSLSFRDAAALPMCFLSAFAGLYRAVQAGDTVYIPGGGGGVGHLAVQMAARALGAGLVISSGSTPQSIALARQSAPHHVFDYKRDDIAAEIAELTSGRGVDLVFDATYSEVGLCRDREDRPAGRQLDRARRRPRKDDTLGRNAQPG